MTWIDERATSLGPNLTSKNDVGGQSTWHRPYMAQITRNRRREEAEVAVKHSREQAVQEEVQWTLEADDEGHEVSTVAS